MIMSSESRKQNTMAQHDLLHHFGTDRSEDALSDLQQQLHVGSIATLRLQHRQQQLCLGVAVHIFAPHADEP